MNIDVQITRNKDGGYCVNANGQLINMHIIVNTGDADLDRDILRGVAAHVKFG